MQNFLDIHTRKHALYQIHINNTQIRPRGFQMFEATRFPDNRHMKMVKLLSLRTGRLYPPGDTP